MHALQHTFVVLLGISALMTHAQPEEAHTETLLELAKGTMAGHCRALMTPYAEFIPDVEALRAAEFDNCEQILFPGDSESHIWAPMVREIRRLAESSPAPDSEGPNFHPHTFVPSAHDLMEDADHSLSTKDHHGEIKTHVHAAVEARDWAGGLAMYRVQGLVPGHVVALDRMPHVESVSCFTVTSEEWERGAFDYVARLPRADATMAGVDGEQPPPVYLQVHLDHAEAADAWKVGQTFTGSAQWGCEREETDVHPGQSGMDHIVRAPFHVAADRVSIEQNEEGGATAHIIGELTAPTSVMHDLDLVLQRTPSALESAFAESTVAFHRHVSNFTAHMEGQISGDADAVRVRRLRDSSIQASSNGIDITATEEGLLASHASMVRELSRALHAGEMDALEMDDQEPDHTTRSSAVRRRARKLWWGTLTSAATTVVKTVTRTVKTVVKKAVKVVKKVARAISSWERSAHFGLWHLVNWNYNTRTESPARPALLMSGSLSAGIVCQNCYAYIGAYVDFKVKGSGFTIEKVSAIATGTVRIAARQELVLPDEYTHSGSVQLFPRSGFHTIMTRQVVVANIITVEFALKAQTNYVYYGYFTKAGHILGPGFSLDATLKLGAEYTRRSGWRTVYTENLGLQTWQPSVNIRAYVKLKMGPELVVRTVLFGSWNVDLSVRPYMESHHWYPLPGCGSYNSYYMRTYLGADASLTIGEPRITARVAGIRGSITVPTGGRLPKTIEFTPLHRTRQQTIGTGCRPMNWQALAYWASSRRQLQQIADSPAAIDSDPMLPRLLQATGDEVTMGDDSSYDCGAGCTVEYQDFDACDVNCGVGTQTRAALCKNSDGEPAPLSKCNVPDSELSRECNVACAGFLNANGTETDDNEYSRVWDAPGVWGMVIPVDSSDVDTDVRFHYTPDTTITMWELSSNPIVGDSDLYVYHYDDDEDEWSTIAKSEAYGTTPEAITMSITTKAPSKVGSSTALVPGKKMRIKVKCYSAPEGEDCKLNVEMRASTKLENGVPYKYTATSDMRAFQFVPREGAVGVTYDVISDDDASALVNAVSASGWPTSNTNADYELEVDSSNGETADIITITSAAALDGGVVSTVWAASGAAVAVTASDVMPLVPGKTWRGNLGQRGVQYFYVELPEGATDVVFDLLSLEGDADIMVNGAPFNRRPSWDGTTRPWPQYIEWSVKSTELDRIALDVTHPDWSSTYHVAVFSYTPCLAELNVQFYEALSQAEPVRESVGPLASKYFLGTEEVQGGDGADQATYGTTHALFRVSVDDAAVAPVQAFAGSLSRFYPLVKQGFAAISTDSVSAGEMRQADAEYLTNSPVSRPFLMAVMGEYHGVMATSDGAENQEGRRLRGNNGGPQLGRSLAETRFVQLEAAECACLIDGNCGASSGRGMYASRVQRAICDTFEWREARAAEGEEQRAAAATKVAEAGDAARDRSVQGEWAHDGQSWAAAAAHLRDYTNVEVGGQGRRLQSTEGIADDNVVVSKVNLFDHSTRSWGSVVECDVDSSDVCTNTTVSASVPTFVKVSVPPTSVSFISIISGTRNAGDLELRLAKGQLPATADSASVMSGTGMGHTFTVSNCLYTRDDFYVEVGASSDATIDIKVMGDDAGPALCPSYAWQASAWKVCDVDCGNGTATRTVACVSESGHMVAEANCPAAIKPQTTRPCNVGSCAWDAGEWSFCDAACAGGKQSRLITCRNEDGHGREVPDYRCGSKPSTTQACNTDDCPADLTYFYWAQPWTECSRECGGGVQTRKVTCMYMYRGSSDNSATLVERPSWKCLWWAEEAKPAVERECNMRPCAEASFDITYADVRELPATPSNELSEVLPAGSSSVMVLRRPTEASTGYCIEATVGEPATADAKCSVAQEREYGKCLSQWQACREQAGNNTCTSCYEPLFECIRPQMCSAALLKSFQEDVIDAVCNSTAADNCADAVCTPEPRMSVFTSLEGEGMPMKMYVTAGDILVDPTIDIPVTENLAQWVASPTTGSLGKQTLRLWGGDSIAALDALTMVIKAPISPIAVNFTAVGIESMPVAISGSLADGASAEEIRAGGETLTLTLSCDTWLDPAVFEQTSSKTYNATGMDSTFLKWNSVAAALTPEDSTPGGWRDTVLAAIMASEDDHVIVSADGRVLTLTLPPVPTYNPFADETLGITIPPFALTSNAALSVPASAWTAVVTASNMNCKVSEWSAWSECSEVCADGIQTRTRSILRNPVGDGLACPALEESRECNTCNPCKGVTCQNDGVCVRGTCMCVGGWRGAFCDAPSVSNTRHVVVASSWGACTQSCGGGITTRTVECKAVNATGMYDSPMSKCEALYGSFATERACNPRQCDAEYVSFSVPVTVPTEAGVSGDADLSPAALDSIEQAVIEEVASVTGVPTGRISVTITSGANNAGRRLAAASADVTVFDDAAQGGPAVSNVVSELRDQAAESTSAANTQGQFLPAFVAQAAAGSVDLTVGAADGTVTTTAAVAAPSPTPVDDSSDGPNELVPVVVVLGIVCVALAAVAVLMFVKVRSANAPIEAQAGATETANTTGAAGDAAAAEPEGAVPTPEAGKTGTSAPTADDDALSAHSDGEASTHQVDVEADASNDALATRSSNRADATNSVESADTSSRVRPVVTVV